MPKTKRIAPPKYPVEVGLDELYTTFYNCPYCEFETVMSCFSYCPNCGRELEWPDGEGPDAE